MSLKIYFYYIKLLFCCFFLNIGVSYASDTLIVIGDTWQYLDDGSNQGTLWNANNFDDSNWQTRNAQFGYGDGDETTAISYGNNFLDKHITYYFRKHFTIDNLSDVNALFIRLLIDDGAIVYLNGSEIYRKNMDVETVDFETPATANVTNTQENVFFEQIISNEFLQAGDNVLAVEVHQASPTNVDLSFDLEFITNPTAEKMLVREPYLQMPTENSILVRWRTALPVRSELIYGESLDNLAFTVIDETEGLNHELLIENLQVDTKYFYNIINSDTLLAGGTSDFFFASSPTLASTQKFRAWVLGDCGEAGENANNVRNAYYNQNLETDFMLLLGDNAYNLGTDNNYQESIFEPYKEIFRHTPVWSCPGNADYYTADAQTQTGAYYEVFSFPKNAESGGTASGTESYYSFDYANVHFISLDSEDTDRSLNSPMLTWLENDLLTTNQEWIIAMWHHPPYSKGSHDSDSESELKEMRQNVVPMLEAAGVDLVLCGHSHSYERSHLLYGHYEVSDSLKNYMILDNGSGNIDEACAYNKTTSGTDEGKGTVYVVNGSSSKISGGTLNHPAMYVSLNQLGSVILEVENHQLDLRFINDNGQIQDYFSIVKDNQAKEISISADKTSLCNNETLWLTATPNFSNYEWFLDGQILDNENENELLIEAAGEYLVFAYNENNCLLSFTQKIDYQSDIIFEINATDEICDNDGTASITLTSEQENINYLWQNGETTATINDLNADTYFVTITDEADCSETASVNVEANIKFNVQLKIWLEGPHQSNSNLMTTYLRDAAILPLEQPYSENPYNYQGSGNVTNINDILINMVDWVLVELRDATDNSLLIAQKAGLVINSGFILSYDENANLIFGLDFENIACNRSYYVVVRHRNHLDIMSKDAILFPNENIIDLTQAENVQAGETQLANVGNDIFAMKMGDFNGDGTINDNDFETYYEALPYLRVYNSCDINFDSQITFCDFNLYRENWGSSCVVVLKLE
ncbi:MAG: metallophosphoesterase [Chitinophagales bacterium]